jgi:hypothetical protein
MRPLRNWNIEDFYIYSCKKSGLFLGHGLTGLPSFTLLNLFLEVNLLISGHTRSPFEDEPSYQVTVCVFGSNHAHKRDVTRNNELEPESASILVPLKSYHVLQSQ